MAIDSREKRAAVVALGAPWTVLPAPDGAPPPLRERWHLGYSYLLPTALPLSGRVRVEVYDGDGNKLSVGPIVEVTALQYGEGVDREGSFSLAVPATAGGADGLEVGQRLRFYREGEGLLPVVGIVETLEWGSGTDEARTLTVSGPSLSHELTWVNTGMNRVLSSRTPAQAVSDLLEGTGWTAGTVDSSALTLSRRYDGASVAAALVDAARYFGFHVRFHDLTRTVDFGVLGESTGQVFANMEVVPAVEAPQEVLPITGIRVSESAADLWNRIIVVGAGEGWGRATMIVWPYELVGMSYIGRVADGGYPLAHQDSGNFEDASSLGNWVGTDASLARSTVDPYDGEGCMLITSASAVGWQVVNDSWGTAFSWWTGAGAMAGKLVKFRMMVQGRATAVGKRFQVQLAAEPSNSPNLTTVFTATASWQLVEIEATFVSLTDTYALVGIYPYDAPAVGDVLAVDRAALWDSTSLPYPVEHSTGVGGEDEHFIEDIESAIEHGRRTRVLVVPDVFPTAGTEAAHRAASVALARRGATYLARHKDPVVSGSFEAVGLHRGIAYPVPVGDTARVRWSGVTADGYGGSREAFKAVDTTFYLLSYRRSLGESGEDAWAFEGASVDEYLQAFEDQFVTVQSAVQELEQQASSGRGVTSWSWPEQSVAAGSYASLLVRMDTSVIRLLRSLTVTFKFATGPNSATVHINGADVTAYVTGGPFNVAGTTYTVDLSPYVFSRAPVPYLPDHFVSVRMPTTTSVVAMTVTAEYATGNLD